MPPNSPLRPGDFVKVISTHLGHFAGRSGIVTEVLADVIFVRFGPKRAHPFAPVDLKPVIRNARRVA